MMWFTLRTSSLMNTSCTPHPNTHCQAAMLGAEQKAFWSAPGQGKGSWFLGRGTDRWCNPEENNQTAELMGKWKILKYHWIKVWLYLYSLMLFSMKKKKKKQKIKKFPKSTKWKQKVCELWREDIQTEELEQRMQLELSLQALCWTQIGGTGPSVPQHCYLSGYSCKSQSQMFVRELWIYLNLRCSAIN